MTCNGSFPVFLLAGFRAVEFRVVGFRVEKMRDCREATGRETGS